MASRCWAIESFHFSMSAYDTIIQIHSYSNQVVNRSERQVCLGMCLA